MVANIHNENKIVIPVLGVIYLASLIVVVMQHFANVSFGFIGFLAWIVVVIGSIAFVYSILTEIFG